MKIRACKFVKGEAISTSKVGVWVAAGWVLSGITLSQSLTDKAYAAAGVSPASKMHTTEVTFLGAPDWAYQVKVFQWNVEEVTE